MTNLKPCPFCGSKDMIVHGKISTWVSCGTCGAEGPTPAHLWNTRQEAIAAWNRRAGEKDD